MYITQGICLRNVNIFLLVHLGLLASVKSILLNNTLPGVQDVHTRLTLPAQELREDEEDHAAADSRHFLSLERRHFLCALETPSRG
jgi:hypothetical protein